MRDQQLLSAAGSVSLPVQAARRARSPCRRCSRAALPPAPLLHLLLHRSHPTRTQVAALRGPLTDPDEDEQRGRAVALIAQVRLPWRIAQRTKRRGAAGCSAAPQL